MKYPTLNPTKLIIFLDKFIFFESKQNVNLYHQLSLCLLIPFFLFFQSFILFFMNHLFFMVITKKIILNWKVTKFRVDFLIFN